VKLLSIAKWASIVTSVILATSLAIVLIALYNVTLAKDWFPFLEISAEFPAKVIAFSTGFYALATLFFVLTAIINMQKAEKQKEVMLLRESLDWATKLGAYMVSRTLPPFEENFSTEWMYQGEYLDQSIQQNVIAEYINFRIQSVYIAEISKVNRRVESIVNDAIEHLRRQIRLLNKYNEQYNTITSMNGEAKASLNIARNEDRLYGSIVKIIETIGNITTLT